MNVHPCRRLAIALRRRAGLGLGLQRSLGAAIRARLEVAGVPAWPPACDAFWAGFTHHVDPGDLELAGRRLDAEGEVLRELAAELRGDVATGPATVYILAARRTPTSDNG